MQKILLKLSVTVLSFLFASMALAQETEQIHEFSYKGIKNCKKCHVKQYKSWKKTNMAKAYEILKPGERADAKKKAGLDPAKDYTKDGECLPCHTTGYGEPGGFISLEETPKLVGVSCEMCHGAGSEYTKKQFMSLKNKNYKLAEVTKAGLVSPVTGDRCTEMCHNEKSPFFNKDETFDFEKRRDEGTHKHFPLKYKHD